ncbi:Chemotaxis protein CheY [Sporomusa silvacetica DSM 10669]|uniref:Chemotaxis protein CheY n=1 Tax=Sporomusa silvacetica DSM 10669 TaxID=1123289 RepID=A0ABZ3INF5_9FIRM|nr:response regulator [Sporomusa silvacetica]OZC18164.1 chemotaxis protein CheY [Sporomusa silvacetica DSM 10669]
MKTVLIVDDMLFMRMALKSILEKNGFSVIGDAENGVEAVKKYKECAPDLVTMDITMPEMSGLEALKKIKEYDENAKVIMVSAMGQERFVKEAIMNGANYFIAKPFKEAKVLETLNKVMAW